MNCLELDRQEAGLVERVDIFDSVFIIHARLGSAAITIHITYYLLCLTNAGREYRGLFHTLL